MLDIHITVRGGDQRSRDKIGRTIRDGLKEQMGSTSWLLDGKTFDEADVEDGRFTFLNPGR